MFQLRRRTYTKMKIENDSEKHKGQMKSATEGVLLRDAIALAMREMSRNEKAFFCAVCAESPVVQNGL